MEVRNAEMEPSRNETVKQKCQKPVKVMTKRTGKISFWEAPKLPISYNK